MRKIWILCAFWGILMLLGSCIPDNLAECPAKNEQNNVDITIDVDTDIDIGNQGTELL